MFRPLVDAQRGKVSFLCDILNKGDDSVGQLHLGGEASAVVQHIVQTLLHNLGQVLGEDLGGLRLVNGRNGLAGIGDGRELAVQGGVDDLFVETGR